MSTTDELTAELRELQSRANASLPPPFLQRFQNALLDATSAALLDDSLKPELITAKRRLDEAVAQHQAHAELRSRIAEIQKQLEEAAYAERMEKISIANAQLALADEAYRKAAIETAWKYRALLEQQAISGRVPGASTSISPGPHVPFLMPDGYQNDLATAMQQGKLPFETAKAFHDEEAA